MLVACCSARLARCPRPPGAALVRRLRAVRRLAAARRPPRRRRALRSLVALARRSSCAGLANAPDWRRTACSSFAHDPASVLTMPEFDSQAAGAKAFSRRMPFERKKNPKKQKSATARWNLAKRARREPAPMDVEDGMRLRVPRIAHASRIACVAHAALTFRLLSFAHRLMNVLGAEQRCTRPDPTIAIPTELLNSHNTPGLPDHVLRLKPGMVVMLLRNLNPPEGLCNGTLVMLRPSGRSLISRWIVMY